MNRLLASVALVAIAASLAAGPAAAQSPGSIHQQLELAESMRTSDPDRFAVLLAILESERFNASIGERERIDYLRAFRLGAYGGRPDQAVAMATALFEQTDDVDLKFRAGALAVAHLGDTARFGEGLHLLTRVMSLREDVGDRHALVDGLLAAASFYNDLGQHRLALRYADDVPGQSPHPRSRCAASVAQVEARFRLSMLPADDMPLLDAIDRCLAIGERRAAHWIRLTLARKLAADGQADDAMELLRLRLPEIERASQPRLELQAHALLATLSHAHGDATSAGDHARRVLAMIERFPNLEAELAARRVLYEQAERAGDAATALAHFRRHAEAERAHLDLVRTRELAFDVAAHEGRLQARQIALLEERNEALALSQALDLQAARRTQLVLAFLFAMLAAAGVWALRARQRHAALRELAETDGSTRTWNRRHFLHLVAQRAAESSRSGEPACLVVLSLDRFKAFHHRHGHDFSERQLLAVVLACRTMFRPCDDVGRLGEDEFAIVLPRCDRLEGARLAEACRALIDERLGPCFGVTDSALSGHLVDGLLADADQALHRARQDARDRVCIFSADAPWARPGHSPRITGDLIALRA